MSKGKKIKFSIVDSRLAPANISTHLEDVNEFNLVENNVINKLGHNNKILEKDPLLAILQKKIQMIMSKKK